MESEEPVFGEGRELKLTLMSNLICLKRKTSKNKEKNPNQTTTKPTPQREITNATTFSFKTLNKIKLHILFWCSVHDFIAVYIFSVLCKYKMNV